MKNKPFWFPNKNNAILYMVFIVFFLLSLDFWGWNQVTPLFFGLPLWVYYLFFLTISLSIPYLLLSKYYWREK
ncbi:MAG: hypothetical protein DRM99_01975 [Thermoplasmata archaeon]|nr:MAG: hypothetical protein DRM99_01975 [Thermoplasmata archaeon]